MIGNRCEFTTYITQRQRLHSTEQPVTVSAVVVVDAPFALSVERRALFVAVAAVLFVEIAVVAVASHSQRFVVVLVDCYSWEVVESSEMEGKAFSSRQSRPN